MACTMTALLASGAESVLKKYEALAQTSQIEWILLKTELRSLNSVRYDDVGLISTVSLDYSAGRVLVTTTVASASFHRAPRSVVERIFMEVLVHAERMLKKEIPEIDLKQNMQGLFLELNGAASKEIASWENGRLRF